MSISISSHPSDIPLGFFEFIDDSSRYFHARKVTHSDLLGILKSLPNNLTNIQSRLVLSCLFDDACKEWQHSKGIVSGNSLGTFASPSHKSLFFFQISWHILIPDIECTEQGFKRTGF